MMKFFVPVMFIGLAALASACTLKSKDVAATPEAAQSVSACADDGPQFAGTGLCVGRSINYIDPAHLASAEGLPEGCIWEMNETMMIGDEALLYQAMTCNGKKTELEFRGGAKTAALGVKQSGFFETVPADYEPVRIVSLFEVPDAKARILDFAREGIENSEESAACEVVPLGDGAPDDAFVVDANAAYKAKYKLTEGAAPGEGYSVCGPFGYTSDSVRYWRVTGGYAFLVDTGQDTQDFNPNSLTVMKKSATGDWEAAQ